MVEKSAKLILHIFNADLGDQERFAIAEQMLALLDSD
jgi:hypothetical protein